ncbi:MAG: hypothetical protein NFCOHLIN_00759 [Gammaproteobacteria bacterium]|nr:hypothetical protein [Gammaproteobacteria bacterium]
MREIRDTTPGCGRRWLVARLCLYLGMVWIGVGSLGVLIGRGGIAALGENGIVEWCQFAELTLSALILLALSYADLQMRGLHIALFALAAGAAARELDGLLDDLILRGGWQTVTLPLLLLGIILAVRYRDSFRLGLHWLLGHYVLIMLWAGAVVAGPFAQLTGHRPFLRLFLPEQHLHDVKRYAEETGEWLGFLLILFAAIELAICRWQALREISRRSAN